MKFKTIKVSAKLVSLEYITAVEGGDVHTDVTYPDDPLPSFKKAMEAMTPFVLDIVSLQESYGQSITVTGLKVKHLDDAKIGLQLICQRALPSGRVWNFNTPYVESGLEETPGLLSADCVKAVQTVINEAEKYLKGERSQQEIPLEEGTAESKGEPGEPDPLDHSEEEDLEATS